MVFIQISALKIFLKHNLEKNLIITSVMLKPKTIYFKVKSCTKFKNILLQHTQTTFKQQT